MPRGIYKRRSRGPYRKTKNRAATTIARAWRARMRRKRGGLVSRTALANRKAIKSIRRNIELKFVNSAVATARTNYCGQILSRVPCDNYGMSQSSTDWVSAGPAATTLPNPSSYCPLMLNPIVIHQAGQPVNSGSSVTTASTENSRLGNDIVMSHFTAKITMVGGSATENGGAYANVVRKQKLTALLILDREPQKQNPTLSSPAPVYDPSYVSCQLYPRTPDNPSGGAGSTWSGFDQLRSLPLPTANPPGVNTGDSGSKNLEALSFYSKDNIIGKSGRFKVLKKVRLSCFQQTKALDSVENLNGSNSKTTATKTLTHKGKYKFHFDSDKALIPGNQTLLLVLYSDTPTNRSTGISVPLNYCTPPLVSVVSRFSFRDP